ncbi:hypothetical protein FSARC_8598 [Fusarium sarcochroum]|uniref:F-box domain-containing protein n=1 Tax=Fusarium sarcochroum TaxID=1208366 RepID=A0A8H4X6T0_9HYPO|nr:hypothetical protein FSARC_8598 [Fusarium sarcochroum]
MGACDAYCAICGGPTYHMDIKQQGVDYGDEEGYMSRNAYDGGVLGDTDMEWFKTIHVVGFNPEAMSKEKYYITGPGSYDEWGYVFVEDGDDPASHDADERDRRAYDEEEASRVFPFHWICLTVLADVLDPDMDVEDIQRGALYHAFNEFFGPCRLKLDYGDAAVGQDQTWRSKPGYEYTAINPGLNKILENTVFTNQRFRIVPQSLELDAKVKSDPFGDIPESLLRDIFDFLDNRDIFCLCQASWTTHKVLRMHQSFWRDRIFNHTPYFPELSYNFDAEGSASEPQDLRKLLLWAEYATRPKPGLKGILMPVANRRRIRRVCQDIAQVYHRRCLGSSEEDECELSEDSFCNKLHIIGSNVSPIFDVEEVYWLRSWDELYQSWTLKTYWNSYWELTGIAIVVAEDTRLFGLRQTENGSWETTKHVPASIWIQGFVFHLCPTNALTESIRAPMNFVTTKGITIHFSDDSRVSYGQDDNTLMQHPVFVDEDMTIIGIQGHMTNQTEDGACPSIARFGLLQTPSDDEAYNIPNPREEELLSWSTRSLSLLDASPWEPSKYTFVPGRLDMTYEAILEKEHIPMRVLMLANNPAQLSKLKSISACVTVNKLYRDRDGNYHSHSVCNLRTSFTDTTQQTSSLRELDDDGCPFPHNRWEEFEIDGPGGEFIEQIDLTHGYDRAPEQLQIRTNTDRVYTWASNTLAGKDDSVTNEKVPEKRPNHRRYSVEAAEGDVIVGIVMGFGHESGRWNYGYEKELIHGQMGPWTKEIYESRQKSSFHTATSYVGALTMPWVSSEED